MRSRRHSRPRDDGFTLVELMVVVLVLGIIVSIALPIFLRERRESFGSATKSDLRNSVVHLERSSTANGGVVDLAALAMRPSSPGVTIIAGPLPGNGYCLEAQHSAIPADTFVYRTDTRRIVGPGAAC